MATNRCTNPNCEYFNKTLPNNAKVCPMCGDTLDLNVIAAPPRTATDVQAPSYQAAPASYVPPTPPPQPPIPPVASQPVYQAAPPPQPVYQPTPPPRVRPPVLRLLHSSRREFQLPGEQGYIGRRGQTNPTVPEIDLSGISDEGVVSRSHAQIYWDSRQQAYMIVDKKSRNGTYLNGNPLTPESPYRLSHGDSLQLGQNQLVCFTVLVT